MDANRFDRLSRQILDATSRRGFLRVLGTSGLAALGAWPLANVDANAKRKHKKKHKRKKPNAKPNAFGCLNVGAACSSEEQCCSGICEGREGRQTCRAHDTGGCLAGAQSEACGGMDVACTTSSGLPGVCGTTTGNAGYCLATGGCIACQTDADCQAVAGGVLGPNAACIHCAAECAETTGGTACVAPFIPGGISAERRIG